MLIGWRFLEFFLVEENTLTRTEESWVNRCQQSWTSSTFLRICLFKHLFIHLFPNYQLSVEYSCKFYFIVQILEFDWFILGKIVFGMALVGVIAL